MFKEMSDNQRRVYLDAVQLYEAFISAFQKSRSYRGGMHWKKAKGRQYLFKTRDRYGYGESLGPRSAETEKILAAFAFFLVLRLFRRVLFNMLCMVNVGLIGF